MNAAVIVFPGSNCDHDIEIALAAEMGHAPAMVWHGEQALPKTDLIVLPGGFSYGDYLRAGAMAAHSPILRAVLEAAGRGTPVLAICNGFQIATEAGLLPGVLMPNASLKYICKDVHLRVENAATLFTQGFRQGETVRMPIGHRDGNYFADAATLERLEGEGRIAFRYCSATGDVDKASNPNGAARNIAGIFNERRTVLGLMPHPERLADPRLGGTDGKTMLAGLVHALS